MTPLDFHIFEVQDFDILIGHPIEKMFQNISSLGTLDVTLGGKDISLPILRSKDSMTELTPQEEIVDEVEAIVPIETPESSLENDAELFTEEEDDQDETIELPTHERPPRQPIELKPLPFRLCYAFLNDNSETPVIISDKLSDEETAKLIAVLEKHRAVFGYSLQDLKGISPALCTHRILIDPTKAPLESLSVGSTIRCEGLSRKRS